jgi:hypothetical protein
MESEINYYCVELDKRYFGDTWKDLRRAECKVAEA